MFSFHVPMKREGEPFKVGYHYNIVITDVSEEELKQLEGGK